MIQTRFTNLDDTRTQTLNEISNPTPAYQVYPSEATHFHSTLPPSRDREAIIGSKSTYSFQFGALRVDISAWSTVRAISSSGNRATTSYMTSPFLTQARDSYWDLYGTTTNMQQVGDPT
jgi:hypothetical protein